LVIRLQYGPEELPMNNAFRFFGCLGLVFAMVFAVAAQDAGERNEIDELRREVRELRQLVDELTRRLEGVEYQRLPRLEQPTVPLGGPLKRRSDGAESVWSPAEGISKLQFPYDIERGSSFPVNGGIHRYRR
jgi:hypothetical protein